MKETDGQRSRKLSRTDTLHTVDTVVFLKVHKRENFLGFDFESCTFS